MWCCDWGDKALQECNLSTQLVRRLQEKRTPVPRCGIGFLFWDASANTAQAKNSSLFSTQSLLAQSSGSSSVLLLLGLFFSGLGWGWSFRR